MTVAVDNGSFVETVPSSVPVAERWEVGQSVPTQIVLGPPLKGRIERPVEASQHVFLGIAVAVFCSFLFLVLALVA